MKIIDEVYGEEEINEEILVDLINCKSLQRLKGISQAGIPEKYYYKDVCSRYDHSVGVMILLSKLDADLSEQIAGLLHDVSHSAFSHLIDYVLGDPRKEDYQDKIFLNFIRKSEIPKVLNKHGFDYREICNHENFLLLERKAPDLCADRIDYALREMFTFVELSKIEFIVENLINFNGKIVFKNKKAGELFAELYAFCQREHWSGLNGKARYVILSRILKRALNEKMISMDDLWTTDYFVINKLIQTNYNWVKEGLKTLETGCFELKESNGKNSFLLKGKFRYVNPEVLIGGKLIKVTEFSKEYRKLLEREKENYRNTKKYEIIIK